MHAIAIQENCREIYIYIYISTQFYENRTNFISDPLTPFAPVGQQH